MDQQQYMYDDQVVEANLNLGDRTDLAYDNDALDVLTELFDNDNSELPDELLNQQTKPSPLLQQRGAADLKPNQQSHILPDSPPYSGSEAYSPESNNRMLSPSAQSACSETSSQSGYRSGQSPDPSQTFNPAMNQQQQLHNHVLLQQQQLQHQHQLQQMHDRQLQLHLQQQAALQNGGQMLIPPMHLQRPGLPPQLLPEDMIPPQPYNSETHSPFPPSHKKRKYGGDSPPLTSEAHYAQQQQMAQVKQEPAVPPHVMPQPCDYEGDSSPSTATTGSIDISPSMLNTGSYQPIKWREFQKQKWCPLISAQGQRVNVLTYRLDGDKGFNFSQIDKAFVCQKKNHFQITSCLSFSDGPGYVMTSDGPKPIEGLYMHFYGAKEEAPNQNIQVDQSQADRSKKKFDPVPLHPNQENSWKVTIGRLHFSDTTLNNMRKRGKPNPDQRYFLLVVGIFAHSGGKEYPIVEQCSEKLIVRASNPGQFQDSEVEPVKWQPGQTPNSVFHSGKVGINTDTPDEALTVAGNLKVMGTIMQPSDRRVKEDITQTDTKDQLRNLQNIQLYNYRYTEEFANSVGIEDPSRIETGVIAQELEVVIPEAVKTTSDVRLASGEIINELKVVDKNRLFMESLGAVKELVNVTDSLENKITYLERFNQKLKKLKRIGSMRSTGSTDSDLSHVTSISTISHVTVRRKRRNAREHCSSIAKDKSGGSQGVCSNKFLQILIFVLVFVMVACVGVILAMLLLEKAEDNNVGAPAAGQIGTTMRGTTRSRARISSDIFETTPGSHKPDIPTWEIAGDIPMSGPGVSGDPFRQRQSEQWLMGHNCDLPVNECTWEHCRNQCEDFGDINLEKDIHGFEILLGTSTQAKPEGASISYGGNSEAGDTTGYTGRKRRSVGADEMNPVEALDIHLTEPLPFKISDAQCVDCEKGSHNYTYAVQVSHSYAGTNAKLKMGYKSGVPKSSRYNRVALCEVPTEPAEYYSKTCTDNMPSSLFNVTPEYSAETQSFREGAEFSVEVGKAFKNVYVFRMTDQDLEQEDLCRYDLSEYIVEFRIWFVRVCYYVPLEVQYVAKTLGFEKADPSSSFGVGEPDQIDV